MFQTKVVEKIKQPSGTFSQNREIYEIRWKNMVQPDRAHMTV
jgi:hypothetical protein